MDGGSHCMVLLVRRQGQWSVKDDHRKSGRWKVNVQNVSHNGGICTRYSSSKRVRKESAAAAHCDQFYQHVCSIAVFGCYAAFTAILIETPLCIWCLMLRAWLSGMFACLLHDSCSWCVFVPQPFIMNRRGRSKPQFLARLPSSDLCQWLQRQVGKAEGTRDELSGTGSVGPIRMRGQDQIPTVVAAGDDVLDSFGGRADRKKRRHARS